MTSTIDPAVQPGAPSAQSEPATGATRNGPANSGWGQGWPPYQAYPPFPPYQAYPPYSAYPGGWQYGPQPSVAVSAAPPAAADTQQAKPSWSQGWFAFTDARYLKGLALGAVAAYLLTNPDAQKAMVKGAVKAWTSLQGGFEEMKEQIQDIRSEMSLRAEAFTDQDASE